MKTLRIVKSAFKSLGRNKLRTFLMMIGVIVGIIALTMVVSAGMGARQRVMERVRKFGLDSLMIRAGGGQMLGRESGGQPTVTLKLEDAEAIKREVREVADISPQIHRPQMEVKYADKSTTTMVLGAMPSFATVWDWGAAKGDFISEEDVENAARVCVIGPTTRKDLFGEANPIGEMIRVGSVQFEVKGILVAKGTSPAGGDMDSRVMIPMTTMMRRLANIDYITNIKVRLKNAKDMKKAAGSIQALLRERHQQAPGVPDDFSIITPGEVTETAEKVAGTFNLFLILVAGISLIAGGVVVSNLMLISVSERRKEIGLRKAVGARKNNITFQFLIEATAVTFTGGIIGIALGVAGSKILEAVTKTPMAVSWQIVVLGALFSSLVGLIAGIQPARRAASIQPIEALKP
jgi:putative ABC transport system permease protein